MGVVTMVGERFPGQVDAKIRRATAPLGDCGSKAMGQIEALLVVEFMGRCRSTLLNWVEMHEERWDASLAPD
jgi:hypothetical protein